MNKQKIVESFIAILESDLKQIEEIIKNAKEEATHEESKPENEYDTRAIESGYLVKAQSKRVLDAKEALAAFKHTELKSFTDKSKIQATALIEVDHNGKTLWFFYMPAGGGYSATIEGKKIQVITPSSPLGESLLGLTSGDVASVEHGDEIKEYEILSIQ